MIELRILRVSSREVAPGEWAANPHKQYVTRTRDTLQYRNAPDALWVNVPIVEPPESGMNMSDDEMVVDFYRSGGL